MPKETVITPKPDRPELKLGELWEYRDLVFLMVEKAFKLSYKQTVLGPLWILAQPLLPGAVYAVVFGEIAAIGTDGIPKYLFYLTGTALWSLFSSSLLGNAYIFTSNTYMFGKVYFPRIAVPVSNMLVSYIRFCIQMLLVLAAVFFYAYTGMIDPVWRLWVFLPLLAFLLAVLGMSLGILVSSLTTKYRDLSVVAGGGVRLLMYAAPIVYPLSQLSEGFLRNLVILNPVSMPVEYFRYILMGSGTCLPVSLLADILLTILIFVISVLLFNRVERNFIDKV